MNPEASNTTILCLQLTKKGDVLLQLSNQSDKAAFTQQVGKTIDGMGEARGTEKWVTLQICDRDALAEQGEA